MCHTERLTVRPDTTCAGHARRWAAGHLHCWQLPENTVDAAVLMLSEAVTNAIVHARTDSTVSLVLTGRHLDVTVTDLNPGQPTGADRLAPASRVGGPAVGPSRMVQLTESGRGLQIIDALAEQWGVRDVDEGTEVWFRLRVDESGAA